MSINILSTLELSGLEKFFCTHGSWIKICHAAHLSGDQKAIITNGSDAIRQLLKRHPRMRSRLRIDGYRHLLEILDYNEEYFKPELFYSVVKTNDDQSWEKIADEECHKNPYTDNGKTVFPLFHFMLIIVDDNQSSNDNLFHLLLFSNHCASDGRSGLIIINDFLTLVTSSDLRHQEETVNKQIIPCMSQIVPRPYGPLYQLVLALAKYVHRREARKLNNPQIPVKTVIIEGESTPYRHQPTKFHMNFASTSTTLYSRLREKCHSQQVTLHGPLVACLALAIHHCFPLKTKNTRYLIPKTIDLDYDLRPRIPNSPLTPSTVGFSVGIGSIILKRQLPLASTSFWTLARKCVTLTNKVISNGELYFTQHLFKDVAKNEQKFIRFANSFPEGRVSEINFSNIGKYPYSCDYNQGQIRLRGLHVINNGGVYRTSNIFFVACAGDGQLDISFANEMESKEKAEEFLNYYISLLEKCADADIAITLEELLADNA